MLILALLSELRQMLAHEASEEDVLRLIAGMGELVALESPCATTAPFLTLATKRRFHRAMQALIEWGVEVDATHNDEGPSTALARACQEGDPAGVALLLAAGADPNAGPSYYKPISCAIRSGRPGAADCLDLVLRAGATPQWEARLDTDLEIAQWQQSDRCMRLLLDQPGAPAQLMELIRGRSKTAHANMLTGAFARIAPLLHDRDPEVWLPVLREEIATADPDATLNGPPRAGLLAAFAAVAALEARALGCALRLSADPDREAGRAIEPEEIAHPAVASDSAVARRRPARV